MSIETMTKIATYTVGAGGVASYTFSNIPQTYTDLMLKVSLRCSASGAFNGVYMQVNGDTSASYSTQRMWSYGGTTAVAAVNGTVINLNWTSGNTATANTFGNGEIYLYNYTDNLTKNIATELFSQNNSASEVVTGVGNGIWNNTSPITSVTIIGETSFMQHSTLTLYGVKALRKAVGNSIKATGGAIKFDGTYVYHVFNSTGAFVPNQPILADVLAVAGGGGGGHPTGGQAAGGGAGGLLTFSSQSLGVISYTCTVGAGGAVASANNLPGSNGGTSQFGGLTASVGGGGGGSGNGPTGLSGGSGGGGASIDSGTSTPGTGTAGQGNNGGAGNGAPSYAAGGGGGAGAVGGSASSGNAGSGGIGATSALINSIGIGTGAGQFSSGNYYFAGGGAGMNGVSPTQTPTGGLGGGGASITAGTVNTGGGGGGRAAGGSGIVIVRYKG